MRLFNKHTGNSNLSDKAATGIANGIIKMQSKFAVLMSGFAGSWKRKQQWIFLYIVCLLFGGMSVIAIVQPFKTIQQSLSLKPQSISMPKNIQKENKAFLITDKEIQAVRAYKQTHPNLLRERPGLYDSLGLIEQMYYSQQK